MATFTWKIDALSREPQADPADTVITATYSCAASEGAYKAKETGVAKFSAPDPDSFIPYDSLTEATVVSWVKQSLGDNVQVVEGQLAKKIENMKNPPVVSDLPPWA